MPAGTELDVRSSFDGLRVGAVTLTCTDGVERALATAYRLFRDRSGWLPVPRRIEVLSAAAQRMEAIADELALLMARDGGKPLVDSRVEVARAIDGVRTCCELLRSDAGRLVPMKVHQPQKQAGRANNQNEQRTARAEKGRKMAERTNRVRNFSLIISMLAGWGTWIRTRTNGVRVATHPLNSLDKRAENPTPVCGSRPRSRLPAWAREAHSPLW